MRFATPREIARRGRTEMQLSLARIEVAGGAVVAWCTPEKTWILRTSADVDRLERVLRSGLKLVHDRDKDRPRGQPHLVWDDYPGSAA